MERTEQGRHELHLVDRSSLRVVGVQNVENFDENQALLATPLGLLYIRGSNLHIRQLDLDASEFAIEGEIAALEYRESRALRHRGRGLLQRMTR
ncbi:MAG: sporulation protein YabP [Clostridia bacterium]|nr:sporulation protein YabP [Clostridia bacterium]MCL6521360.1 sporulation protein YabP [Bacillota bacterium]